MTIHKRYQSMAIECQQLIYELRKKKVNHFAVAIKQKFTRLRVLNVGELSLTGYIHSLLSFGLALNQKWFVGWLGEQFFGLSFRMFFVSFSNKVLTISFVHCVYAVFQ